MKKITYADVTWVENKDRKPTANKTYLHVNVEGRDYLFTDAELTKAYKRAGKNTEDLVHIGWVRRILTKYLYAFK